jgi:hypothetical protein
LAWQLQLLLWKLWWLHCPWLLLLLVVERWRLQLGSCQHLHLLWLRSSSCCRRMLLLLQLLAPPPLLQLLLPCCQSCCFRVCCRIITLNARHTQPLLLLSATAVA